MQICNLCNTALLNFWPKAFAQKSLQQIVAVEKC